jgi:hypothetical protein
MKIKKRTITIVETHSVTISGAAAAPARAIDAEPDFIDAELPESPAKKTGEQRADQNSAEQRRCRKKLHRLVQPFRRKK